MKSTTRPGIVLNPFVHNIPSHSRVTWTDVRLGIWELGEAERWAGDMTLICERTRCGTQAVTGANSWALQPHLNTSADSSRVVGNKAARPFPLHRCRLCVLRVGLKNTQHGHNKNLPHDLQLTPQYTRKKTLTK